MKQAKYVVKLTREEREILNNILNRGSHTAEQVKRARVLLELDKMSRYQNGAKRKYMPTKEGIAAKCSVSASMVGTMSKKYVEEGLEATLNRKKRETPPRKPIITGEEEARIIALTCSDPPEGYQRWTLRLLEKKVVELGILSQVSDNTIGRALKKTNLSLT